MTKKVKQKQIALNNFLFLCIALFIVFLGLSIISAFENEVALSIAFSVFALLPTFVFAISPLYYIFSKEELIIVYNFGQRELIKWDNIRSITLMGSWIGRSIPHYSFAYPRKDKRLFFIAGEVCKTPKTTRLIRTYYKGNIS